MDAHTIRPALGRLRHASRRGTRAVTTRIHLVVDEAEKERFRRHAERRGLSLSEWLREAARNRAAGEEERTSLDDRESLESFFRECDRLSEHPEPDWEDHERRIHRSIRSGSSAEGDLPS